MNADNNKECSTCFFTCDFPGVTIGEDGRCNFCADNELADEHRAHTIFDLTELKKIAEEIKKNKSGKYDCIIGASGGLDSSYVIYVAKKLLGLNPLVVKYDNGFNNELAVKNLETLCKNLDLDLIVTRSKKQYDLKYVRYLVKGLKHTGSYYGVCFYCHYILPTTVYRYALQHGIKTTLVSYNIYEDKLYLTRRFKMQFVKKAILGGGWWRLPKVAFYVALALYNLFRLKMEFYLPPFKNFYSLYPQTPPSLKAIDITKYIRWDVDKMVATLEAETGWKAPAPPHLPMRFDCRIGHSLGTVTYLNAVGMTGQAVMCNNLIYDGVRSKEQLIESVEDHKKALSGRMDDIMKQLGLD